MTEMRVALDVDEASTVTIAPVGPIDFDVMDTEDGAT